MSSVNFMEKLLDRVGVEWKALGEIGEFVRGKRFVKTDITSDGIPCIHYGEMYTHFGISAKESRSFLDAELASKLRFANHGDVIIVAAGETIEDIGNGTAWIGEKDVVIHDACFAYKSKLNPTYVSHFLRTKVFKEQIKKYVSSGKISSINSSGLGKASIPVPCPENPQKSLEIQAEIVRILDVFTELTAELTDELTAELTARKIQYNYYCDQLLSFEGGEVVWKTLGEITTSIASGRNKARSAEGPIPVYGSTGPLGFTSEAAYSGDALLVARVGANAGLVNAVSGNFDVSDNTLVVRPIDAWNIRFAFHQLTHMNLNQYAVGAGQPLVTGGLLKSLKVPFPPMEEQVGIASILDKFDALTNSISEFLAREIELRQKQYEHYRDLLLSFPKQEEAEA
ncbi:restriction endonuclease subunit S [Metapseudomonas lalkuanensis]|uniref:restriction endonuclease subunit S n=1 Tax=Metapseudomonas lalkuanensis TaxID=2604832 RepID=UPI001CF285E0|nr:restriction endonuclease subunit S [Pseudomonas lalkuanensis]UCO97519.1 restriction endonuclease subunit S [Pseudomonas lalkuanensis]